MNLPFSMGVRSGLSLLLNLNDGGNILEGEEGEEGRGGGGVNRGNKSIQL